MALVWAQIEQSMILTVSALTAQDHDGNPTGNLRTDFKRLRDLWWAQSKLRLPKAHVDKVLHPLNTRLAEASKLRGQFMHGTFAPLGQGRFRVRIWEQRGDLDLRERVITLREVREFRIALERLRDEFEAAVT